VVETIGVSKSFTDRKGKVVRAVDDVSIQARPGAIFGLLGVNGAGKTTLLRVLSTVIRPTSGTAKVNGTDVLEAPQKVRETIGFLSNTTALYGRLTPTEVLAYFGSLYGLTGGALADRIAFVTDKLQLHEFKDRLCDKLSTGQKQRVSIARAILHDPPVLFFDEPTAGLDVVTAQTIMEFIEEQRDHGRTVVFSTHVMSEAERLCDEVAVIHNGRICGRGTLSSLLGQTGETRLERAFLRLVGYEPKGAA
jgi:sodium transport system ATP-binding protein